ncbi:MAG: PAS domain S-box protein [Coleofasciculus sp. A1-SPW-01]|uniref:PAS domain S-box protein n=1 Tax=Coleofasciculus sp. A1-SPW-01 TaxID=3070819 RepID=UPI0032FC0C74
MNSFQTPSESMDQPANREFTQNLFLRISDDLFGIWHKEGYWQPLNPAWEKVLGWTEEELRSHTSWELIHPDDRDRTIAHFTSTEAVECEHRLRHQDGSYRWLAWKLIPVEDGRLYGVGKNITETKHTEAKLKERIEFEQLITSLSHQFIQLSSDGIEDAIKHTLEKIGKFCECDRTYMALFSEDTATASMIQEWDAPGVSSIQPQWQDFPTASYPWGMAKLRNLETIQISRRSDLPPEANSLKQALELTGAKSIAIVPIAQGNHLIGYLGCSTVNAEKIWSDDILSLLQIIGGIFANALSRQQAESQLRESERRFRAVFNQTFQLSSLLTLEGNVVADNQTATDFCQLDSSQVIGYPFWQLKCWTISAETQQQLQTAIAEAATGKTIRYEADILAPDQSVITIDFSLKPLRKENGEIELLIAEGRDISDRKQAEAKLQTAMVELEQRVEERTHELQHINEQLQAEILQHQQTEAELRNSEQQFRRVFDEAPIGMTLADLNDRYIRVNRSFYTMLGYSQSEVMALSFKDITHPDELALEIPYMQQLIKGEIDSFQLEKRYIKKNKDLVWVNLTLIALRDKKGEFLYTLAMVEDITERKQAMEALRQSEARYRAIVEDQTELICRFKADGTFTFVNDAYCRYFNKQRSELIGYRFKPQIPEIDQEFVNQQFKTLSVEQPIVTYEHRVILPDNEIRWQQWTERVMFDNEGNIVEFQGVGRDITPLKKAEAEIIKALEKERELSELRSSFVSLVSHEFRTPLTAILSSSELLDRYSKKLTDEKKKAHHQRIQIAVSRMTQLLDDVLTIGKAEAGKLTFKPASMNLIAFCQDIVDTLQMSISQQHSINFVCHGDCGDAQMDEKLLQHILNNLISNAIKYSSQGSEVKVELTCEGESAIFHIQDQGIGIPPEDIKKLFSSFQRAGNVGTIQGTGLGLAIVKKCVDLHGGLITVESEVGKGTTFTIILPLQSMAE